MYPCSNPALDIARAHVTQPIAPETQYVQGARQLFRVDDAEHFLTVLESVLGSSEIDMQNIGNQIQLINLVRTAGEHGLLADGAFSSDDAQQLLNLLHSPMNHMLHNPQSAMLGPQSTMLGPQSTMLSPQSTMLSPQSTMHSPQSTLGQHTVVAGDLPPWVPDSSGHIEGHGHGSLLNTFEQDDIASTIRANGGQLPSDVSDIIDVLDQIGAYNPGQPPDKKAAGAYLALNTLSKMSTMPPERLADENTASAVYGALKVAGVEGNGAKVREILTQNGGNTLGLSDQQLADAWGVNEHHHLHAILFGNSQVYNPIHMTSLNDKDMWGQIPGEQGMLGGFNDRGEYPQWGWFEDALNFQNLFGNISGR